MNLVIPCFNETLKFDEGCTTNFSVCPRWPFSKDILIEHNVIYKIIKHIK